MGHAVSVDDRKNRIVDQVVVDQPGAGSFAQFAPNRVLARSGKTDQGDDRVLERITWHWV